MQSINEMRLNLAINGDFVTLRINESFVVLTNSVPRWIDGDYNSVCMYCSLKTVKLLKRMELSEYM